MFTFSDCLFQRHDLEQKHYFILEWMSFNQIK